eukprot:TRINITY_DN4152_c0_g1_i1.p1 TRINITY_DN4152_c0_g1~~TRINITY_DN4152_c0_g1_i1.p1  ORF type:complete len:307 (-),score=56.11 TRINITY_DN4152_c0_g1_i1:94-1014(-)
MWCSARVQLALVVCALLCFSTASAYKWTGSTQTMLKTNSTTTIYGIDGEKIRSTVLNGTMKQTLEVDYHHGCSRFTETYFNASSGQGMVDGRVVNGDYHTCSEQLLSFGEDGDNGAYCSQDTSSASCKFDYTYENVLEYLLGNSLKFYVDFEEYALSCDTALRSGAQNCASTTVVVPNPMGPEKRLRTDLQMSFDGECKEFDSCTYSRNVTAFYVPQLFFMQSVFLNDTSVLESRDGRVVSTQITTVDGKYHSGSVPSTVCLQISCPQTVRRTQAELGREDGVHQVAAKGKLSVAEALGMRSLHML